LLKRKIILTENKYLHKIRFDLMIKTLKKGLFVRLGHNISSVKQIARFNHRIAAGGSGLQLKALLTSSCNCKKGLPSGQAIFTKQLGIQALLSSSLRKSESLTFSGIK
jgi:hypothetical protein